MRNEAKSPLQRLAVDDHKRVCPSPALVGAAAADQAAGQPAHCLRPTVIFLDAEETESLTPAEMKVLLLVAKGDDNQAIADNLALSLRTVSNRLSMIYEKLRVKNRIQAALYALKQGWVALE